MGAVFSGIRGRHWVAVGIVLALAFAGARSLASADSGRRARAGAASARSPLPRPARSRWVAAWSASPQPATSRVSFAGGFDRQTVRNIVYTTAAGSMVRVQFSNVFGRRPLDIGGAAVGPDTVGAGLAPGSDVPLTFSGRRTVVIPAGAAIVSDPVRLAVRPLERLGISVFLPQPTGRPTDHAMAEQVNYVAAGDRVLARAARPFATQDRSWYFVTRVDVWSPAADYATVVAFGDSITDGARSLTGANARWPNDLARRLDALRGANLSVVDAGIAGNQLVTASRCCGISGLARFRTDALGQPAVKAVIVLEGVNDIGAGPNVSAQQIIDAYRQMIALAHAAGVAIFGATLTPFQGAFYWTPAGEAKREAVNAWIRHSGAFDGVIDFAAAVADPRHPERYFPAYDSGDHLHPNDAGYLAMANAVNLSMLLHAAHR